MVERDANEKTSKDELASGLFGSEAFSFDVFGHADENVQSTISSLLNSFKSDMELDFGDSDVIIETPLIADAGETNVDVKTNELEDGGLKTRVQESTIEHPIAAPISIEPLSEPIPHVEIKTIPPVQTSIFRMPEDVPADDVPELVAPEAVSKVVMGVAPVVVEVAPEVDAVPEVEVTPAVDVALEVEVKAVARVAPEVESEIKVVEVEPEPEVEVVTQPKPEPGVEITTQPKPEPEVEVATQFVLELELESEPKPEINKPKDTEFEPAAPEPLFSGVADTTGIADDSVTAAKKPQFKGLVPQPKAGSHLSSGLDELSSLGFGDAVIQRVATVPNPLTAESFTPNFDMALSSNPSESFASRIARALEPKPEAAAQTKDEALGSKPDEVSTSDTDKPVLIKDEELAPIIDTMPKTSELDDTLDNRAEYSKNEQSAKDLSAISEMLAKAKAISGMALSKADLEHDVPPAPVQATDPMSISDAAVTFVPDAVSAPDEAFVPVSVLDEASKLDVGKAPVPVLDEAPALEPDSVVEPVPLPKQARVLAPLPEPLSEPLPSATAPVPAPMPLAASITPAPAPKPKPAPEPASISLPAPLLTAPAPLLSTPPLPAPVPVSVVPEPKLPTPEPSAIAPATLSAPPAPAIAPAALSAPPASAPALLSTEAVATLPRPESVPLPIATPPAPLPAPPAPTQLQTAPVPAPLPPAPAPLTPAPAPASLPMPPAPAPAPTPLPPAPAPLTPAPAPASLPMPPAPAPAPDPLTPAPAPTPAPLPPAPAPMPTAPASMPAPVPAPMPAPVPAIASAPAPTSAPVVAPVLTPAATTPQTSTPAIAGFEAVDDMFLDDSDLELIEPSADNIWKTNKIMLPLDRPLPPVTNEKSRVATPVRSVANQQGSYIKTPVVTNIHTTTADEIAAYGTSAAHKAAVTPAVPMPAGYGDIVAGTNSLGQSTSTQRQLAHSAPMRTVQTPHAKSQTSQIPGAAAQLSGSATILAVQASAARAQGAVEQSRAIRAASTNTMGTAGNSTSNATSVAGITYGASDGLASASSSGKGSLYTDAALEIDDSDDDFYDDDDGKKSRRGGIAFVLILIAILVLQVIIVGWFVNNGIIDL